MEKGLRGLLEQAATDKGRNQGKRIVRVWQAKAWSILALCVAACLFSIYWLWRPWRFLAMGGIALVFALCMYLLIRGYNRMIVRAGLRASAIRPWRWALGGKRAAGRFWGCL